MVLLLLAPSLLGLLLLGCEQRVVTPSDCAAVKQRLEDAWQRDAVAAQRLADTDRFNGFIRDEQRRIGDDWMKTCEGMVGRPVSEREIDCLRKVETIDDVNACAGR
ncbi:MAG: hypothetical protein R3B72_16345 [Polyangiaceae bacterium]